MYKGEQKGKKSGIGFDLIWEGGGHMEERSQVGDVHAKRGRVMSRGESNRVTLC